MSQPALHPLRFEPIYRYQLWGGRCLANPLTAPLPERVGNRDTGVKELVVFDLDGEMSRLLSDLLGIVKVSVISAGAWQTLYSEDLKPEEKEKIVSSLKNAVAEAGFKAGQVWGEVIEDRGSQITFSALGQQAPLEGWRDVH
jgi:hypothetical protein